MDLFQWLEKNRVLFTLSPLACWLGFLEMEKYDIIEALIQTYRNCHFFYAGPPAGGSLSR